MDAYMSGKPTLLEAVAIAMRFNPESDQITFKEAK
jgi:predicted ATPase